MNLAAVIRSLGSIATREQIISAGFRPGAIVDAMKSGEVIRVRRAWFAVPEATFEQRVAVALGGKLGGLSAARSYGLWTGNDRDIHVSWSPHGNVAVAGRRRAYAELHEFGPARIVPHWRSDHFGSPREPWRESLEQTVAQVLLSAERPLAAAVVDSALALGVIDARATDEIFGFMPSRIQSLRAAVDGRPDSGLESVVRCWLIQQGLPFQLHALIAGLEVDFLVGRSLVIETDGSDFHSPREAFERDRVRDAIVATRGYIPVRFSYQQITEDWPSCESRLREHLARGDHMRPVAP